METLGKRIGQLRRATGMKQDELAEKLGVTPQAVSKWENDVSSPDISLLPQLAQLLGITIDELLSGKKAPETKLVPVEQRRDIKDMVIRIVVDSGDGDKVRINLPLALIMALGDDGEMPTIGGSDALRSIDLKQIVALVEQGAMGNLLEVESADGDVVRIYVE